MTYEGDATVYPSRRDGWVSVALWVAALGMVWASVAVWSEPAPLGFQIGMTVLLGASAVLVLWVFFSTSYRLSANELLIRSGPFRWIVPLDSIEEIRPTRNLLSGPALSLDRLRIRCRGCRFGLMISPKDRQAFLGDLTSRAQGLKAIGDRLVQEPGG